MSRVARAAIACQRMYENEGRPVHSDDLVHLALALPLKGRDRNLLACLSTYAHTGMGPLTVWPSRAKLAKESGMGVTAIVDALRSLEKAGLIRREGTRRVRGSGHPNRVYRLRPRVWVSLFAKEHGWHPRDPAPPPKEEPKKQATKNWRENVDDIPF